MRVYAVVRDTSSAIERDGVGKPEISLAPHHSMAVLPFAIIGGDPEQEYFVDGGTGSLTTDLSRINGAFVIAHNTACTFKGKAVDVKKLGNLGRNLDSACSMGFSMDFKTSKKS